MKASDLRDRTTEDLRELERSLAEERFSGRFKNFTNRLDDTSLIRKNRRDLARVKLILAERARGDAPAPAEKPAKPAVAPKPKAPKPAPKKSAPPAAAKAETDADHAEAAAKPASKKSAAPPAAGAEAPAKKTKAEPKPSAKGKAKSTEKTESK